MNCPVCGASNTPESKFCVGCGSVMPAQDAAVLTDPAPQASASAAPKAKFDATEVKDRLLAIAKPMGTQIKALWSNKKLRTGILGGTVVLIALMIICAVFFGGNGFVELEQTITYEFTSDDEVSIIVDKKVLKDTISTKEGIEEFETCLNGKAAAILTGEGELYVIKGSKVKSVADDVTSFELSVSGKGVAYATRGEDDENTSLYVATVSNAKSTEITDNLANYNFKISPDGKSVAYYEDNGEDGDELMLFKGKDSTSINDDDDTYLYGLSNSGKQIYVGMEKDGETYLYSFNKKGEKSKLESLSGSVRFNDDHAQVIFENKDGKTYISKNGKEAVKASSDSLDLIIAPGSDRMGETYPVSDLYGHVYESDEGEAYMIKKNKDIKLVSKASRMQLDASAEYLYYIYDNRELRVIEIGKGERASEAAKTIVRDNVSYVVTSDRKYVYFTDDFDSLMSVNGKKGGIPKEIADDVDFSSGLALSNKDRLYYVVDDDLYVVDNGKSGKKILGDVDGVYNSTDGNIYAYSDDSLFASTGSKKLKEILERD